MRHRILAVGATLLMALTIIGCARASDSDERGYFGTFGRASTEPAVLQVSNFHPLRIVVRAVSAGQEYRLGEVETANTETFALPNRARDLDLRVRLDPIGSRESYLTRDIHAGPGDVIEITVEGRLAMTRVNIR